ncbi:MAG TPA: hypothetical protein VHV32_19485 [Candidatus Angelobacter sp.]|jgi:hypothetical protein|nr:hypothetical protein [Candidatus Angelobacter sp.]
MANPVKVIEVQKFKMVEKYFQLQTRQAGTCGHKHTTAKQAEGCRKRMEEKWLEWRYGRAAKKTSRLSSNSAERENLLNAQIAEPSGRASGATGKM